MAELKATVCLQGKDIEVISSHIEFNRKTDNKGRPVTNVIGGRITITSVCRDAERKMGMRQNPSYKTMEEEV